MSLCVYFLPAVLCPETLFVACTHTQKPQPPAGTSSVVAHVKEQLASYPASDHGGDHGCQPLGLCGV